MNKDTVKGKVKDVVGRAERQVGEWTGDPKKQAEGAAKQVEGKLQNAWGQVKDAANKGEDRPAPAKPPRPSDDQEQEQEDTGSSRR
jgi:uncharacterized protein YjbJ (UPF0337 family)